MVRVTSFALASAILCAMAVSASALQQTSTTETKSFEVIDVRGNDLVVKLPEGTREITVPEDFRFTVDGQQLSVHDLKRGMKGTATITTKTTSHPVTVTEVKNGTVVQSSGSSIIVRTDQGFKMFSQSDVDKRGVKIVRDGQPAEISDFHAGDQLTATIITTKAPRVVTEKQVQATLARSGAAAAGAGSAAASAASPPSSATSAPSTSASRSASSSTSGNAGGSASSTGGATRRKLPKTASQVPLLALVGMASLALGLVLTFRRRASIG